MSRLPLTSDQGRRILERIRKMKPFVQASFTITKKRCGDPLAGNLTEWRTKADLTKHLGTREFLELLNVMDLSVQTPVMEFKTMSQTAGLEMVEELIFHHELSGR